MRRKNIEGRWLKLIDWTQKESQDKTPDAKRLKKKKIKKTKAKYTIKQRGQKKTWKNETQYKKKGRIKENENNNNGN